MRGYYLRSKHVFGRISRSKAMKSAQRTCDLYCYFILLPLIQAKDS